MDKTTVIGLLLGLSFILGAIFAGPTSEAFWNPAGLLIVVGGVLATTLIRFPARVVASTTKVIRQAFLVRLESPTDLVGTLVQLTEAARKDSLLALDRFEVKDPFLRRGVELCVDGVEPAVIESVLRGEIASVLDRHYRGQRIFKGMGTSAPAFGMIGTLIGLVQMLTSMEDPSKIGGAMAVAILTTFYGAFMAYLIFFPVADKLAERSREELVNRELIVQGLMGMLAGQHPRIVERHLVSLLEPTQREYMGRRRARRRAA